MNGTAQHSRKTETCQLSQGLAPNPKNGKERVFGRTPLQIPEKRTTALFDLIFPILPRPELFGERDAQQWNELAHSSRNALDSLTQTKGKVTGKDAPMRFFGQLERLHSEFPDALLNEFEDEAGTMGVAVFKPVHETSELCAIPMETVFSLRKRSPQLFTALLSFIHGLPFDNVIKRSGYILKCLLHWTLEVATEDTETEGCCRNGQCLLCFIERYHEIYEGHSQRDWMAILNSYRPRKPLYQELRQLLLDAPYIDFNAFANLSFLGDDTDLRVHDLVVFIDVRDSQLENAYLSFINEMAQEVNAHTIYDVAVCKADGVQGFGFENTAKVNEVLHFMQQLNDLLLRL